MVGGTIVSFFWSVLLKLIPFCFFLGSRNKRKMQFEIIKNNLIFTTLWENGKGDLKKNHTSHRIILFFTSSSAAIFGGSNTYCTKCGIIASTSIHSIQFNTRR